MGTTPSHQLGGLGTGVLELESMGSPGAGREEVLKMHLVGMTFLTLTAQICIHKITTKFRICPLAMPVVTVFNLLVMKTFGNACSWYTLGDFTF